MIKLFLLLIRVLIMISKQAEQNTAVASIRPSVRWSQSPIVVTSTLVESVRFNFVLVISYWRRLSNQNIKFQTANLFVEKDQKSI